MCSVSVGMRVPVSVWGGGCQCVWCVSVGVVCV